MIVTPQPFKMNVAPLILEAIERHDLNRPRSLQREVGPSDLGDPCEHCLAAKLAGWEKRQELAWLPYIGTAVHAQLAQAFDGHYADWHVEKETFVGNVNGVPVFGTADLFHVPTRTVVDFKVVGVNTLRTAKRGDISEKYRTQVHLYGLGLQARNVAIMFLPRSSPDLAKNYIYWEEPFDPYIAERALARASRHAHTLDTLSADERILYVKTRERADGCYDCPRYIDWDEYCERIYQQATDKKRSILASIMD